MNGRSVLYGIRMLSRHAQLPRGNAYRKRIASSLICFRSFFRCMPLLFSPMPKTPLRVLCVMAFDSLHRRRHSRPLTAHQQRTLAAFLDFGAAANAMLDQKYYCGAEIRRARRMLDDAGLTASVDAFLRQLQELERRRPLPLGDETRFSQVRCYREAVIRLFLQMIAATALGGRRTEKGIRAIDCQNDLRILFKIAMQCQIVDDVLDYASDMSAGLPSFLTASKSLSKAIDLTEQAARQYADGGDLPKSADDFPFRVALSIGSLGAKLMLRLARLRSAGARSSALAVSIKKYFA